MTLLKTSDSTDTSWSNLMKRLKEKIMKLYFYILQQVFNRKCSSLLPCLILVLICSCKSRSISSVNTIERENQLYPVASLEINEKALGLLGHFPFQLSQEVSRSLNSLNSFIQGDSDTVVNVATEVFFDRNGINVMPPKRISEYSKTDFQVNQIPLGRQAIKYHYQNKIPEVEREVKDTIWKMFQEQLDIELGPLVRGMNRTWNDRIMDTIFNTKNSLKIAENMHMYTSAQKIKFLLTDLGYNEEPLEINTPKPSVQLNIHPDLFNNFIKRHIHKRSYTSAELAGLIQQLPFINLGHKKNNDQVNKPEVSSGIEFTTDEPIKVELKGNRLTFYIQGIFFSGNERTDELLIAVPYNIKQYQSYARIQIDSLTSKSLGEPKKTIFAGIRSSVEKISVRTALANVFPTYLLPYDIPIYKDQKNNIKGGFSAVIARNSNGWLQFVWNFEQNIIHF